MSRNDAVILASRGLGVLMAIWALAEASYLPERVLMLLHYTNGIQSANAEPYRRDNEIGVFGFLVVRIIGFAFMSKWLLKGGSDIEELLFPTAEPSGNPN